MSLPAYMRDAQPTLAHWKGITDWLYENGFHEDAVRIDKFDMPEWDRMMVTMKLACGSVIKAICYDGNRVIVECSEDKRPPRLKKEDWAGDF